MQEEAGIDVNLLLFLLWHATRKRALSAAEVAELERRIGPWRDMTVIPLRTLRRALKSPPALVAAATAELFRTKIKAVELEAERLQQEAMYELARASLFGTRGVLAANRRRVPMSRPIESDSWRCAFSTPAVETLLAALTGSSANRRNDHGQGRL